MKKDIDIPEVKGVQLAAVHEWNEDFNMYDWNAYVINENDFPLETLFIVSKGYDSKNQTSTMRHTLKVLPAKSFAKIELLQPEILKLNNQFSVSFFYGGKLLHKNFVFNKNVVKEANLIEIPLMDKKGVTAE